MINRAFKRAVRRVRGDHPRRKSHPARFGIYVLCDLLLIAAGLAFLVGVGFVISGLVQAFDLVDLGIGAGLVLLAPVLLILWEKVFWEPVAHTLERLT